MMVLKQEIPCGTHLAIVNDVKLYKDATGNHLISSQGESGIVVEYALSDGRKHDQVYWYGSRRQYDFDKLCKSTDVDNISGKVSKKIIIGKRVWISVREEYTLLNGAVVKDSLKLSVFNTNKVYDPTKKPILQGDPERDNGRASGDFLAYIEQEKQETVTAFVVPTTNEPSF